MVHKIICFAIAYLTWQAAVSQAAIKDVFSIDSMVVYEADFSRYLFDSSSVQKRIFILKHNKSCLRCFETLSAYLKSLTTKEDSIECFILSLCDSAVFCIKMSVFENKTAMPGLGKNLFAFSTQNKLLPQGSVFDEYSIDITPALLFQNGKKTTIIQNHQIFMNTSFNRTVVDSAFYSVFR